MSAIVSIPVDPPDETIIMVEIVRQITIERNSRNWYLHLNLRDGRVKKSLNIGPIAVFEETQKSGWYFAS
jgi:hypothetical protein